MELSKIHPSHQMGYSEYGSDNHDDHSCKTCQMSTCLMCPAGRGMDDGDLAEPCIGFPWLEGVYDGDRMIGRRSGTGWPKAPPAT